MLEKEQKRKQRVWLAQFGASTTKRKIGDEKTLRATPPRGWCREKNMNMTCHMTKSHPVHPTTTVLPYQKSDVTKESQSHQIDVKRSQC